MSSVEQLLGELKDNYNKIKDVDTLDNISKDYLSFFNSLDREKDDQIKLLNKIIKDIDSSIKRSDISPEIKKQLELEKKRLHREKDNIMK